MQYRQLFFYLFTLVAVFPVTSFALSLEYNDSGAIWYTDGIAKVGTDGASMEGMTVRVTFSDGTTEKKTWIKTADPIDVPKDVGPDTAGSGEASSAEWSLTVNKGSTYLYADKFMPWVFTIESGVSVSQLFIDAGTGNTVFDRVPRDESVTGDTSTDGSESGNPFVFTQPGTRKAAAAKKVEEATDDESKKAAQAELEAAQAELEAASQREYEEDDLWNTTAEYSGPVALKGQEPVGDLYRYLSINFGAAGTPLSKSDTVIYFSADTDTVKSALVVPEPSTLMLFGLGLAGLAGVASRKRRT